MDRTKEVNAVAQESSHGAAGQALGFVHQCMWALVELGKRGSLEPKTQLRLETLDDIEFGTEDSPTELLQTKHHTRGDDPLTAQAVDLWRTLNVWMDLPSSNTLMLRLVTTRILSEKSGLICLRTGENRDTSLAVEELLDAAKTSTSKATKKWRDKFLSLDEAVRVELVDRIIIDDGSLPAAHIDEELARTFRYAYRHECEEVFIKLLKGWWSGVVVQLLCRKLEAVTGQDLIVQVGEIADQLRTNNLPIDPDIMREYNEPFPGRYGDRLFVQQLLWIALEENRLWKAIRDYHRSSTQRSFWLRHQLLGETELNRFAFRLNDEWEQTFDSRVAAMKRERRTDQDVVGQEILEELSGKSRARLRDRFDEPWFSRGMFHALANGEFEYQIGWHPDFKSKLEEMLNYASPN